MSEKKLYAVCLRKTFYHAWTLVVNASTGEPLATTIAHLVDVDLGNWLRDQPEVFIKVTLREFIEDLKNDISNARFVKMLGWNYAEACRLVERDGAVFILTMHPVWEAKPYSFAQARDDDDYALQLLRDIYATRGGLIHLEEFDSEKHVKGYKPTLDM
ncbi:MAG: hypothetical protein LBE12_21120 [Planctomycetaceae bacterium]|jgi:hypothetical protein|nr:hypothetical protein [Planctomycetaceae bacterium]